MPEASNAPNSVQSSSRTCKQMVVTDTLSRAVSVISVCKKRSKKADERFYGCEKVANISQFGCLHYFQNSVIVHKEKKQKLMFNECFYIDKDKAKLYVQCLDQNF